jgi:hypothetical protein
MHICLDMLNGELVVHYSPGPFLVLLWASKEVRKSRFSGDICVERKAAKAWVRPEARGILIN